MKRSKEEGLVCKHYRSNVHTIKILCNWSISESPGKKALLLDISKSE